MTELPPGTPAEPGARGEPAAQAGNAGAPDLERVVDAISDGAAVEWESELADPAADPETLDALRLIDQVARLHRTGDGAARDDSASGQSTWGNLQIRGPIGAGVYGEVYRAYDPALQREVALKLWSSTVRPRIIERLLEEARALARVRHPNVLLVHGADTHDGRVGMWTELLEGTTLEQLIVQHGGGDWREAAVYGMQLCRALSAVHAIGFVHRDVKAANVMRERGGRIVLMDFGSAGRYAAADVGAPNPEHAVAHETVPGVAPHRTLLAGPQGTPLAMAPEVLAGAGATPAADLYSLGVLLFRLVSARYPVEAGSLDELRAKLGHGPVASLRAMNPSVPLAFASVVERALGRDPAARAGSAAEMERALAEALSSDFQHIVAPAPGLVPEKERVPWRALAGWAAVAVVVTGALAGLWWRRQTAIPENGQPMQFTLQLPPGEHLPQFANVVVAPDGSRIVFASTDSTGHSALWVRRFDALNSTRLPGTEGAKYPFWSPDSRQIGFFSHAQLKRVGTEGDSVRVICTAELGRGGAWSRKGTILFAGSTQGPLLRVSADGGTPVVATEVDTTIGEVSHRWPCFLPDGEHFLYVTTPARDGMFSLYAASLHSDRRVSIGPVQSGAVHAQGMLVYMFKQGLEARPFNLRTLRWSGEPVPVEAHPALGGSLAEPQASVSQTGTLVHTSSAPLDSRLMWYDLRTGATSVLAVGPYFDPRLSPDGRLVAVERAEGTGHSNLWMVDARTGEAVRWSPAAELNRKPIWSDSGDSLLFSSNRTGSYALYVRSTAGSLAERVVYAPARALLMWPNDWRASGEITFDRYEPGTGYNVYELRGGAPVPIARTPAFEARSAMSPDGRWLSYDSDASGTMQIHVVDRITGEHFALAGTGIMGSRWVRATGHLIYHSPAGEFFEVTPIRGRGPHDWPSRPLVRTGVLGGYDVDARGERLLCSVKSPVKGPEEIAVLVNLKAAVAKGL